MNLTPLIIDCCEEDKVKPKIDLDSIKDMLVFVAFLLVPAIIGAVIAWIFKR